MKHATYVLAAVAASLAVLPALGADLLVVPPSGGRGPAEAGTTNGSNAVLDVRDFGAVGDGKTLSTQAIQKAVDECAAGGGGTVLFPAGTWLTGTVYLQSNVTLLVDEGCTLLGSRDRGDYAGPRTSTEPGGRADDFRYAAILAGSDLENVTLRGPGTIDGQGDAFRDKSKLRPKNIYLQRCRNVTVEGLRLRNAGCWMQHYRQCEGLTIRRIDVFNHVAFNNDGLNVDSCLGVLIEDCRVDSDDDAVVLKSLSLQPCRDVVIRRCTVSSHCNAIKMGTESGGGFQDVTVSDCTVHSPRESQKIYGAQRGLAGIALEIVDGGTLKNVTVSNVRIDGVTAALFLRLGNRARIYEQDGSKPGVGTFRNVILRDLVAENTSEVGCSITGLPGHPIQDVLLENIRISFDGGGTGNLVSREVPEREDAYPESTMFGTLPAWGLFCRHAEGLVFRNVELRTREPDLRHAMVFDDVRRLELHALDADWSEGAAALLRLAQVEDATIRGCRSPAPTDSFLLAEGDRTAGIVIEENHFGSTAQDVKPAVETYRNPVIDQNLADPAVIFHEGTYYLYGTGEVDGDSGYRAYTSKDLVNWEQGPVVFQPGQPHVWAPDVWRDPASGRFWLYYTADRTVGVAEAAGPLGPFIIRRKLFDSAIDAHLFQDDDGRLYLYFVEVPGFRITVQPMAGPGEPSGEPKVILQPESDWETRNGRVTEGPWMIKHGGRYYLLYSGSGASTADYAVGYATSSSPTGPFTRAAENPILHRSEGLFGPGHGCAVRDGRGQWWFVYHQKRTDRREWDRFISIDRLEFDQQGRLGGRATRGSPQPAPVAP